MYCGKCVNLIKETTLLKWKLLSLVAAIGLILVADQIGKQTIYYIHGYDIYAQI